MKTLDEQIADIEKLDLLRQRAGTLRQQAIEALTSGPYVPRPRDLPEATDDKKALDAWKGRANRTGWHFPGDDVEKAEVLRALAILNPKKQPEKEHQERSREDIIADLIQIGYVDLDKRALDDVPVFRCALVLQALAETPEQALSATALSCFYRIVQEIYEVAAPDWMSGAARADKDSQATAFITGECARALLALEEALSQTAKAAKLLGEEATRAELYSHEMEVWSAQEDVVRKEALQASLAALPRVLVPLSAEGKANELLLKIVAFFNGLTKPPLPSGTAGPAESVARVAVDDLFKKFKINIIPDAEKLGGNISEQLRDAAEIIRNLLRPTEKFAEFVINREIASSHQKDLVDSAELLFAANLLGLVSDWKKPKILASFKVLHPLLSTNGRLLSIRPFDVDSKGYRLNVATLEVTRRVADLLAHLDVDPAPEFVERLMLPFEDTRASSDAKSGWTTDPPPREPKSLWWLTATALDALESMVRMLDATINRRVLQNFQVRQPETLDLTLDKLFYPDYALAKTCGTKSVAVILQRLRQHAANGRPEEEPLYSLILYGPPGTGKTTLVEAVAKTAGVPLVEVTPSDILVGGVEGMEHRARQVFRALSKLTHVVILFDEFDSILLDRTIRGEKIPTSVVEFLTPGMLPKLKALNGASKTGRISYVLATNFLDRIDSAIQRGGRFDEKCGIYPPDVVSRLGRLIDQLKKYKRQIDRKVDNENNTAPDVIKKKLADYVNDKLDRILAAVKKTRNGPMDKLGKPGWYTMPDDKKRKETVLFDEILDGKTDAKVTPEAKYKDDLAKYKEQHPQKDVEKSAYWKQWKYINDWDNQFEKKTFSDPTEINAFIQQATVASERERIAWEAKLQASDVDAREETKEVREPPRA